MLGFFWQRDNEEFQSNYSFTSLVYINYYVLTFCISENKSEFDTALYKKHADELARDLADERSSRLEEIQRMHDGTWTISNPVPQYFKWGHPISLKNACSQWIPFNFQV